MLELLVGVSVAVWLAIAAVAGARWAKRAGLHDWWRDLQRRWLLRLSIATLKYQWPPFYDRFLAGVHELALFRLTDGTWRQSFAAAWRYWW